MASAEHSSDQARQALDIRLVVDAIPTLAWSARTDACAVSMAYIVGFFFERLPRSTTTEGLSNGSERTRTSKTENARNACSPERITFWRVAQLTSPDGLA